ncbi:MAG: CtsR family transcriptional regulator [Desulfitobacteriaceae bacterium]|nr:CtsR family transcriptional regulator [Desulfitobacteriaceae bacterium]MDD4345809.1 CtsR family transcriptional regulator [Desulfitobacteriaceae bacterium]MDD4400794.1 CtsR family transcriptional regulator [Desulfitobacteriaceae bacterium]
MGNLADRIEKYLKQILEQTEEGYITLQRSVLADEFSCAPSQINYVLDTRFTVEHGYIVESRRGGGGYLRIIRLVVSPFAQFQMTMRQLIGEQISQKQALGLVTRLMDEKILTVREAAIIKAVISRLSMANIPEQDKVRAGLMKYILATLCREDLE